MLRGVKIVFFCLISGVLANSFAVTVQKSLEEFVAKKMYATKGVGIVIKEVGSKKSAVSINGEEMLNPASVSKLVTGAAAFELLKNNFEFKTQIFNSGSFESDSGIVRGDLYIRGGGDPGFTAERLWLMVQHLYHRGIKKITGNLVLDDFYFDSVLVGPGFDEDSNSRAYQPLISALSASFSTLAIHHRSGPTPGSPVLVDVFPKIAGLTVTASAKTVSSENGASLDIQTIPTATGTGVVVKGTRGINQVPQYTYRKVWQSWETFGGAIMAHFNDYNIIMQGKIVHDKIPDKVLKSTPFYEFTSQPLSEYVNHMFKYSSNFAAEMIFKTISATDSTQGSWNQSSNIIKDWWKKNKFTGEPHLLNGSGMGNVNRLSALQLVELLDHVWSQKYYLPEYLSALSISGIDGTLKSRFKNSILKGIVRGKTGTLNSHKVSTLAGYLLTKDKTFAFAILCNNVGNGQYDNWVMQEETLEKFFNLVKKGEE